MYLCYFVLHLTKLQLVDKEGTGFIITGGSGKSLSSNFQIVSDTDTSLSLSFLNSMFASTQPRYHRMLAVVVTATMPVCMSAQNARDTHTNI